MNRKGTLCLMLMISTLMMGFSSEVENHGQPVRVYPGQQITKLKTNRTLLSASFQSYKLVTSASFLMSRIMKRNLNVIWEIKEDFDLPGDILFSSNFSNLVMFSAYILSSYPEQIYLYHKGTRVRKIRSRQLLHSDCYDKLEEQTSLTELVSPSWIHRIKLKGHVLEVTTLEGHTYRFNMKTGAVIKQTFSKEDLKAYNSLEGAEPFTVHHLSLKPQNCEKYYSGPKDMPEI